MRDISVILVTHNSESEIGACLDALDGVGQVIVVDNASSDASVAIAARRDGVALVANPMNRGFAAAVNQGARIANGRYLLLLNPDAVLTTGCEPLREACERSGIAAGCLVNGDGAPQIGFTVRRLATPLPLMFECLGLNRMWRRNPINTRYRCLDLDLSKPCAVEQPAGAFLMIRRDVFDALGGFDEGFWPVWFEDVDFCRRAANRGYKIEYSPDVRARHSGGHSIQTIDSRSKRLYWYGSLLRYAAKHYRPGTFRTVCCAIVLGSLVRMPSGMISRHRQNRPGDYSSVLRLAVASFIAGRVVCPASSGSDLVVGTQNRQVVDEN